MKFYKQLINELTDRDVRDLEDILKKERSERERIPMRGKLGSDPETYLSRPEGEKRAPSPGTGIAYTQRREEGKASGLLGGLAAGAMRYASKFYAQHGYEPVAARTSKAIPTYDYKKSIEFQHGEAEGAKQKMLDLRKTHAANLRAHNAKKSTMDPVVWRKELDVMKSKFKSASGEIDAALRTATARKADLETYGGYETSASGKVKPKTNRGYEGGYERY